MLGPGMVPGRFFYPKSLPLVIFLQSSLFDEVFLAWVRTHRFIQPWFIWCMDAIDEGRAWPNVKQVRSNAALRVY
jgi:hypothetical protein